MAINTRTLHGNIGNTHLSNNQSFNSFKELVVN